MFRYRPSTNKTLAVTLIAAALAFAIPAAQAVKRLGISERTVRFHVDNARRKLGVETRSHAVSLALQLDLIAL
jgi:DNA-binding CsgD family transcriptional regulator